MSESEFDDVVVRLFPFFDDYSDAIFSPLVPLVIKRAAISYLIEQLQALLEVL